MGPIRIKKKKKKKDKKKRSHTNVLFLFFFFFLFFFSLTSLFDIRESDRQNSSREEAKCSTQRGLRMGTKNTGFSRVFN